MKKLILFIIVSFLLSCNKNEDCPACFTPPEPFLFEVVDKTTGENLFLNGTYDYQDIEIINSLNDNAPFAFEFITEDNVNLIYINSIGWTTETVNLKVSVSGNYLFDFYVDAERKSDDCCNFTQYNEANVLGTEYEYDSGIIKVLID